MGNMKAKGRLGKTMKKVKSLGRGKGRMEEKEKGFKSQNLGLLRGGSREPSLEGKGEGGKKLSKELFCSHFAR